MADRDFFEFSCNERGKNQYFSNVDNTSERRWYQHDIDTIVYSDMFRKLQRKSQLFSPFDPLSRSRLIHTLEVVRIAKEISEKLGLNPELTEGIALAHDFGNVAYGKVCDDFLVNETENLFKHEEISKLMLQVIASKTIPDKYREKAKEEINKNRKILHTIDIDEYPYEISVYWYKKEYYYICIAPELLDGVVKHGTDNTAFTLEGQVVNYADNIAYLIQDISDFESSGIFSKNDKERYSRCLNELSLEDDNKLSPITNIVATTESLRTATLIERYVAYNLKKWQNDELERIKTPYFDVNIPVLKINDIDKKAIDRCWEFKKEYYDDDLILISNINSLATLRQLWEIINENSEFVDNNIAYQAFQKVMESPIFLSYREDKKIVDEDLWQRWKRACFVSYLTCDEIDLIIHSFLSRDYIIDLTLPNF